MTDGTHSSPSHCGGITDSEDEREADFNMELDEELGGGGEVAKGNSEEAEEIQDYQVVWARVVHWPWWPGVVSSRTRRRGKTLQREVVFFGEDNRGLNTESYLVSGARIFLTLISWCSGREEHQTIPWEG